MRRFLKRQWARCRTALENSVIRAAERAVYDYRAAEGTIHAIHRGQLRSSREAVERRLRDMGRRKRDCLRNLHWCLRLLPPERRPSEAVELLQPNS